MLPDWTLRVVVAVAALSIATAARRIRAAENGFTDAMAAAMTRMDDGMMAPASGDPDRDFATMMIPHHQGAVEMAEAELRFGHDQVLRRLAQGIIIEQLQEIDVMQRVLPALEPTRASSRPMHTEN